MNREDGAWRGVDDAVREFEHVGLAQQHGAGGLQPADHSRIRRGDVPGQQAAAGACRCNSRT